MSQRKILVTSALPYANGDIHLGHLVEYIQTDIWVRFQKLRGNDCIYICADDTHGTAIMLAAQKKKISPEEYVADIYRRHLADFTEFGVNFDFFGNTNSKENREVCEEIWAAVRNSGLIESREVEQLFDLEAKKFLADREVRGTCPKCGKPNQYGDNCEACGAAYSPADLKDAVSVITGSKPELRTARHLFFETEKMHEFLNDWVANSGALQSETVNYLKGQFLGDALYPWDISRPAPYFGFEIPDSPGDYWYVWYDAPIGYIGTTKMWCAKNGGSYTDWWRNPECEIHHFIGKDIAYFHTLFWPSMLKTAGFNLPKKVNIHGFLTVNGAKMSKSRGTFIKARTYLKHLNPSWLRYFFAAKMAPNDADLDLDFHELEMKINSDLVGCIVNLASRTAKFAHSTGLAPQYPEDNGLFQQAADLSEEIAQAYEDREYGKLIRTVLDCCYRANQYWDLAAPWKIYKEWNKAEEGSQEKADLFTSLQNNVTIGLNLFRQIIIYLAPILPELREKTEELLNTKITSWSDAQSPILGTAVNEYKYMMVRVPAEEIDAMIEEEKKAAEAVENTQKWNDSGEPLEAEPLSETINFDDFMKVDLRVGRIIEAEHIKEAKKLLKLKISLGGDQTRQIFAGIKAAYPEPEKLIGRLVVFVANLEPRQMKFGLSEGMVVASGPGGSEVFLISPDEGAKPGQRIH